MQTLPSRILALITDPERHYLPLTEAVERAIQGGISLLQLRDKRTSAKRLLRQAQLFRELTRGKIPLLINDRIDIAIASKADGVHLPEEGLPVPIVRKLCPYPCLVGRSVHSLKAAQKAIAEGVDYLQVGTIFPTECKPGHQGNGTKLLADIRQLTDLPIIAIGGISTANIPQVLKAGASGVAVVSAILRDPQPEKATRSLRQKLDLFR